MQSINLYLHDCDYAGGFTLKEVRRVTWEARSKWYSLGNQLGVGSDTLQVD